MKILHFIGLSFGLGGATISTIISVKAEKDTALREQYMKVHILISKLIGTGIFLLLISGIYLSSVMRDFLSIEMLLVKHVLVLWILIFGSLILIHSNRVRRLAPEQGEKPIRKFSASKKLLKIFSRINLVLWYLITIISFWV